MALAHGYHIGCKEDEVVVQKRVVCPWTPDPACASNEYLRLALGELLLVYPGREEAGWAFGRCLQREAEGFFPPSYVVEQKRVQRVSSPWTPDAECCKEYLPLRHGELLLVYPDREIDGWAFGRSLQMRR